MSEPGIMADRPADDKTDPFTELFQGEALNMSKSERTRLKIMASAAKVFTEKGFSDASIQDIANDAGLAKGTIYYYINKKEDLFIHLVQFGQTRLFSKIEKSIGQATTASEKLEAILQNHLSTVKTIGSFTLFFMQSMVSDDSRVRNVMAGFRQRYINLMASVIEEGIASGEFREADAEKIAVAITGMVVGQIVQQRLFDGKINTGEILSATMDVALNGLRARHES